MTYREDRFMVRKGRLALVVCLLSLAACTRPSIPVPSTTSLAAIPTVQAVPVLMQVIRSNGLPEKRVVSTETIPQPNCGGSAIVSNDVERTRSIAHTLEIGGGVSVSANGSIEVQAIAGAQLGVGATVAANYGVSYGATETISRKVTVQAKEGTNMLHTVQQVELWETGELSMEIGGQVIKYPYSFRKDFSVELVKSEDLKCLTPTPGIPTAISPTATRLPPTTTPAPLMAAPVPEAPPIINQPVLRLKELHYDDFSSAGSGWDNYTNTEGKTGYSNGKYFIEPSKDKNIIFLSIWKTPGVINNGVLQADILGPIPEGGQQGIGFAWKRGWGGDTYDFTVDSEGYCAFVLAVKDPSRIGRYLQTSGIAYEFDNQADRHTLTVRLNDGTASGFVDNTLCAELSIPNYEAGYIGVVAGPQGRFLFDDFRILAELP